MLLIRRLITHFRAFKVIADGFSRGPEALDVPT
jgi:hypothetical protein